MRGARFMVASSVVGVFVVALAAAPPTRAAPTPPTQARDAGAGAGSLPACVAVQTSSRYVPYGYNHVVTVKNGCTKNATCSIATDVNPTPAAAEIASNATVEILTFAGSPAATFFARVTCKLH